MRINLTLEERQIIDFAKKEGAEAVYNGHNPEDRKDKTYFLLIPGRYNSSLVDRITELEIKLFQNKPLSIMRWPIPAESAVSYSFLKKCIWKRE